MNTSQQKAFELFGAAMTALKEEPERNTGYLNTKQACEHLNIGRTFLWKLTKAGLKSYVLGRRKLYKKEDLNQYVLAQSGMKKND